MSQKIRELVLRNETSNSVRGWENHGDIVETISDSNLFGDIASVQDIRSDTRNLKFDVSLFIGSFLRDQSHLLSRLDDDLIVKFDTEESTYVLDFNLKVRSLEIRADNSSYI